MTALSPLPVLLLMGFAGAVFAEAPAAGPEIRIEGKAICVDSNGNEITCPAENPRFAFRTDAGHLYRFLPDDVKARIFEDPRIRSRHLLVRAWPKGEEALQVIKVYSIRNGTLYDLYYYCPVCSIRAYAGGPCWCCQDEFEFHEEPLPPGTLP